MAGEKGKEKKKRKMSPASLANLKPQWKKGEQGGGHRPKNRLNELIEKAVNDLVKEGKISKFENLTDEEVRTADKFLISAPIAAVQAIMKNDDAPLYIRAQAVGVVYEMRDGKTTTVDKLRDRVYGAAKQNIDITSGGVSISQPTLLTITEASALISKLDKEY